MPRDGSGVYTLPAGNPVVTNTVIASAWANTTMSDIAAQLNNVLTRDGLLGPTGPFKLQDGTVAAPGLAFASEPGLGWYRGSAGTVGFAAGGVAISAIGASAGNTNSYLYPNATGASQLLLCNQPATATNYNALSVLETPTDHNIREVIGGSAPSLPLNLIFSSGVIALNSNFYIKNTTSSATLTIDKAAGAAEGLLIFSRAGLTRWRIFEDSSTESGGNAGSNLAFQNFNDAGLNIGTPISIARASGNVTMPGSATVGNSLGVTGTVSATANYTSAGTGFAISHSGFSGSPQQYGNIWSMLMGINQYCQCVYQPLVGSSINHNSNGATYQMPQTGQGLSPGGWGVGSDIRMKEAIEPISDALAKVLQLIGCTYDKLDCLDFDGKPLRKAGIMAQHLQQVLPEAVTADLSDEDRHLYVDDHATVALVINSIKELHERISHLEFQAAGA